MMEPVLFSFRTLYPGIKNVLTETLSYATIQTCFSMVA